MLDVNQMKIAVILPAAGRSKRFHAGGSAEPGGRQSKIEMDLGGRPVFLRSVELFLRRPNVVQTIVAVDPDETEAFNFRWGDKLGFHGVEVVAGGTVERWETVKLALAKVRDDATHVAIHDAARPLASAGMIDRVFEAAAKHDAVIPAQPVAATLKRVEAYEDDATPEDPLDDILGGSGKPKLTLQRVTETIDRSDLVEVQTPQVFEINLLRQAYAQVGEGGQSGAAITDDAGLVEALGKPVMCVEGQTLNFKITRPDDLELARLIVSSRDTQQAAEIGRKRLFGDDDDDDD